MSYIGYLPSYVRYHSGLSDKEKLLYCELTALADKNSFVKLDREHLCKALGIKDPASIRRYLNKLGKFQLIELVGDDFIAFNLAIKDIIAYTPVNEDTVSDAAQLVAQEIIDIWNNHFETKFRTTKQLVGKIKSRLRSFTKEELILATHNRLHHVESNPWINERENIHHKKNIDLLIRDDQRVEKFVNYIKQADKKDVNFARETIRPSGIKPNIDFLK